MVLNNELEGILKESVVNLSEGKKENIKLSL
jgi:hypothetical protein